ncbi:hypothetical protein ACTA71_002274 [Dictyostelium dimigraforme]
MAVKGNTAGNKKVVAQKKPAAIVKKEVAQKRPVAAKKENKLSNKSGSKVAPANEKKQTTQKQQINKSNNKKAQPKEIEEFDENSLKKQLQDMISNGGGFDDEDDEDFDSEDDNQDVMDFDDSEDDDEDGDDFEGDEEEEDVYGDDLNEVDEEEEEEEDDDEDEEEDGDDNEIEELFEEMNSGDEEDEEEEEKEVEAPKTNKRLSKKIEMSGTAFQGFASVSDILKEEAKKPRKAPEMIREINSDEEVLDESGEPVDSENEMDREEKKQQQLQQEQEIKLMRQKYVVNDIEGMKNKLRDFKLSSGKAPWVHTLAVTSQTPLEIADIHDDFNREIAFYKQTLQSVTECERLCVENGLPVRRKPDYFAEMIKSDQQMHKIKSNIQSEKKRVETAEMIRKKREIKKFGKQVQTQKLQERQKQKSDAIESVKKWRKNREKGNVSDEFNIDLVDEVASKKDRKKVEKSKLPVKGDKRKKKDAKYGFGGKKRYAKTNDKNSVNDISGFSVKKNNEDRDYSRGKGGKMNKGGKGAGKGASKGAGKGNSRAAKQSRPGKSKRAGGRK